MSSLKGKKITLRVAIQYVVTVFIEIIMAVLKSSYKVCHFDSWNSKFNTTQAVSCVVRDVVIVRLCVPVLKQCFLQTHSRS